MHFIIRYFLFTLILTCFTSIVFGQEDEAKVLQLNLAEALKKARANNLTIQTYEQGQEIALAQLEQAKDWWMPNLFIGTRLHNLTGGAMNGDGGFFTEVNRNNSWLGLSVDARWNIGENIFQRQAAELKTVANEYRTVAQKNEVLLQLLENYYGLLTAQWQYSTLENLRLQQGDLVKQVQVQADAGVRLQSEALLAQSNFRQLGVSQLKAKKEWISHQSQLLQILNLPQNTVLMLTDSTLVPLEIAVEEKNKKFAAEHPLLLESYLLEKAYEKERKSVTTGLLIPDAQLDFETGSFGKNYENSEYTNNFNIGVGWNIPLGQLLYGGEKKETDAKIVRQETITKDRKNQLKGQVYQLQQEIALTKEQFTLAQEAGKLSEQVYSQSLERQNLGIGTTFEVVQAQEMYVESLLSYFEAVAAYNVLQYRLLVARGKNL